MQDLPPLDPDGVTVGQLSPRQGLRRVDAGGDSQLVDSNGMGQSTAGQSAPVGSGSSGLAGSIASFGLGLTPIGQVPGVGAGVNAATQGGSLDAIQDAILGSVLGWGASSATSALGLGFGLPGIAGATASEFSKDDPNYGAAAIGATTKTGLAMLGGALAGPLGAYGLTQLGGPMVDKSLSGGYLGDVADSRSREKERDAVEDAFGVSVEDTAQMARVDTVEDMLDRMEQMAGTASGDTGRREGAAMDAGMGFGYGLDSFNDSTMSGQLSSAADKAYGINDLIGYLDSIETEDIEIDAIGVGGSRDSRSDYGRSTNERGYLGDRDLSSSQNMDRQPDESSGGLFGGDGGRGQDSGGGSVGHDGIGGDRI